MNGIHQVLPNEAAQPEFKKALVEAAKAGVQIVCYSCHVEADRVKITGCNRRYFKLCEYVGNEGLRRWAGERV